MKITKDYCKEKVKGKACAVRQAGSQQMNGAE